jgi:nitroreductase
MAQANQASPEGLLGLIRSRRSVRQYRPDPVPDEMIQQMLEAGRWAPSANNQQPWAFVVVQDGEIRCQIAQHATFFFARDARVEQAPLLIVLCGQIQSRVFRRLLRGDVSMAGMQMMLQAHALGLGTCWIDELDRDEIAAIIQIPDDMEIVAMLAVGFPAEIPTVTARKSLFEIAHYDVYDSLAFGGGDSRGS